MHLEYHALPHVRLTCQYQRWCLPQHISPVHIRIHAWDTPGICPTPQPRLQSHPRTGCSRMKPSRTISCEPWSARGIQRWRHRSLRHHLCLRRLLHATCPAV
ncbi:unnamed protein product [Ectocarpus sp. 12 AP-2014]